MNFVDKIIIQKEVSLSSPKSNLDFITNSIRKYLENAIKFEKVYYLEDKKSLLFKKDGLLFFWRQKDFLDNGIIKFKIYRNNKINISINSDMRFNLIFIIFSTILFSLIFMTTSIFSFLKATLLSMGVFLFFYLIQYLSRYFFLKKLLKKIEYFIKSDNI